MFDIRSLTWDEWSHPEGVILPIVTLGTIRPEDSGAARNATEFSIKLHSETQVSGRLGMSAGLEIKECPRARGTLNVLRARKNSGVRALLAPKKNGHKNIDFVFISG